MSAQIRMAVLPACLLAALASPAAFADAGMGLTQLDAVEVTGQKPDDYAAGSTDSATRLELTPRETPQSVSVITRAQMDDYGLEFLKAKGSFSIGSDSNVSVSVSEELRWLEYGQRLKHQQRNIAASEKQPAVGRQGKLT